METVSTSISTLTMETSISTVLWIWMRKLGLMAYGVALSGPVPLLRHSHLVYSNSPPRVLLYRLDDVGVRMADIRMLLLVSHRRP